MGITTMPPGPDRELAHAQFWSEEIATQSGFLDAIGLAPGGIIHLTETRPFSRTLRLRFALLPNDDATNDELEALPGSTMVMVEGRMVMRAQHAIDFRTRLGWSQRRIADVENPEVEVFPDYGAPIGKVAVEPVTTRPGDLPLGR
jgi:hypothetical protein